MVDDTVHSLTVAQRQDCTQLMKVGSQKRILEAPIPALRAVEVARSLVEDKGLVSECADGISAITYIFLASFSSTKLSRISDLFDSNRNQTLSFINLH